jgi:hypothetical protein
MVRRDGAGQTRDMAVADVDARLVAALREQLARRHGARVGWKLGIGERERIGGQLVVGNLTSATRLEPGATYFNAEASRLHADAEVAVEIGEAGEIAGYAAAVELVDLDDAPEDSEGIVAANIFHRAFALGPTQPQLPQRLEGRLLVNGNIRASGEAPDTFAERDRTAAKILSAVGERPEPGDRIITGSVVQIAVHAGEEVSADFGPLGLVASCSTRTATVPRPCTTREAGTAGTSTIYGSAWRTCRPREVMRLNARR